MKVKEKATKFSKSKFLKSIYFFFLQKKNSFSNFLLMIEICMVETNSLHELLRTNFEVFNCS